MKASRKSSFHNRDDYERRMISAILRLGKNSYNLQMNLKLDYSELTDAPTNPDRKLEFPNFTTCFYGLHSDT